MAQHSDHDGDDPYAGVVDAAAQRLMELDPELNLHPLNVPPGYDGCEHCVARQVVEAIVPLLP